MEDNKYINVQIGKVKILDMNISNYFPLIGELVTINSNTKWATESIWNLNDGILQLTVSGNLNLLKDNTNIKILDKGELKLTFKASNKVSEDTSIKTLYAMEKLNYPYFNVTADEVIRVNSYGNIIISSDNGYDLSKEHNINILFYRQNENLIIKTISENNTKTNQYSFIFNNASDRGVYDIEVQITDCVSNITTTKKIFKLITITPLLCPKPLDMTKGFIEDYEYKGDTSYEKDKIFHIKLWKNVNNSGLNYAEMIIPKGNDKAFYYGPKIGNMPKGTTLVLKKDPLESEEYAMRLFLFGSNSLNESNKNGLPNCTYEYPLIITHDCKTTLEWKWQYYGAFLASNNMRNFVIDGYGYNNTKIHFSIFDSFKFSDSCLFLNNGSSQFEIFGIDIDGAGFAGIVAKTDPNPNNPWFWRENGWKMTFNLHHLNIHDTIGEGVYIGYFDPLTLSGRNNEGKLVHYHAHTIDGLKLYRCIFKHNGYDSIQINNSKNVEVCYCNLSECGYLQELNLGSAFSCTFDGKIYNCLIQKNENVFGVMGPWKEGMEIYNTIITASKQNAALLRYSWNNGDIPDEDLWDKNIFYNIHNNILYASTIGSFAGDVEFTNWVMNDNVFITINNDLQLPYLFHGSGNIFIDGNTNFSNIDSLLKVADSENLNFLPAYNSILITSGKNFSSLYDARGYKNWYIDHSLSGPYMGKYKDTSIVDEKLKLLELLILEGNKTYNPELNIKFNYLGSPTLYRVSEDPSFSDTTWKNLNGNDTIKFLIISNYGNKIIYGLLKNNQIESEVKNVSINYYAEPIKATMSINDGSQFTTTKNISIKIIVTGVYNSLQIMISDNKDFIGSLYLNYISGTNVSYSINNWGINTIYVKVKSDDNLILDLLLNIELVKNKCLISTHSYRGNDAEFLQIQDGFNKYSTFFLPDTLEVKDIVGNKYCTMVLPLDNKFYNAEFNNVADSEDTGNNSGCYLDEYLRFNSYICNKKKSEYNPKIHDTVFKELVPGQYTIRIFSNGKKSEGTFYVANPIESFIYLLNKEYCFADFGLETFYNNFNTKVEIKNVIVSDDGILRLSFYLEDVNKFLRIPINIIEIEKQE